MDDFKRRDILLGTTGIAAVALAGCQKNETEALQTQTPNNARADYTSQKKVADLIIPDSVVVIGTGGFGCWPALIAAMSGAATLHLIDASDVSALDLARAPFRPSDIGRPKAQALGEVLRLFRPDLNITWKKRFVNPQEDDIFLAPVVFDGTNSSELGAYLSGECAKRKLKYVQGFYNGLEVGTANGHVPSIQFERGEPLPVWGGAAMLSGCLAAASAFAKPFEFYGEVASIATGNDAIKLMGSMKADK